jgi:methionyl-tRNA synthetase
MEVPMIITTTIPYVNARPHIGFLLELVQADVLARHHRRRGKPVRLQTGTDDNSLKNVLAAQAAGVPVTELVDRNAAAFTALHDPYALRFDDVVHTGSDPRHRAGVERLWHACAHDLYRRHYEGDYCVGCERFFTAAELVGGRCPEHDEPPERVAEHNWFFRLSRYAAPLRQAIEDGTLRIHPAQRRNEVLAFLAGGLDDISVSRDTARARGWGIPVPGDPGQVVYVWWDALGNYVTGPGEAAWRAEPRRIHLLGKGVIRFHAVYWPALLLSAGLPLPTDLVVHDYLTVDGRKISKSGTSAAAPAELAERFGADAVRWWLLRDVPRVGDTDFTVERLAARADTELANGIGNLVHRVASMVHRYHDRVVPTGGTELPFGHGEVDAALDAFDFRRATNVVWDFVTRANRYVNETRPWTLGGGPERDAVLATLVRAGRTLATELAPFLPATAAHVAERLPANGQLPVPVPLFGRFDLATTGPFGLA